MPLFSFLRGRFRADDKKQLIYQICDWNAANSVMTRIDYTRKVPLSPPAFVPNLFSENFRALALATPTEMREIDARRVCSA